MGHREEGLYPWLGPSWPGYTDTDGIGPCSDGASMQNMPPDPANKLCILGISYLQNNLLGVVGT